MNRRSLGGFRRSRGLGGGSGAQSLTTQLVGLLGSNLVAFWDAAEGLALSGSNVVSWTDRIGDNVSTPTGAGAAPTYGADGSNFKSRPVVQFASSAQYMAAPTVGLVAAGGRPLTFAAFRFRTVAGFYPYVVNIPTDRQVSYCLGVGGAFTTQFASSTATVQIAGPVQDAVQHQFQAWLDGTNGNMTLDGTTFSAANAGVLTAAVDAIEFSTGAPSSGSTAGPVSLACVGVCTVAPSPSQRAALSALLSSFY
jgi:hypothetical protein